ncbi:MAG: hypothetical protein CMG71_08060 [Candidatus Marinimicrobia bacterium]|nr:hypothetical protein [Candidatus Neomarinimicrobiota bacterium]|tara:strand:- start:3585 stop:4142 length:558 start_codon:yes stop_codon:yes gene_type:complete
MKKGAIFLDRDGTLNPDPGYISSPADFELYDSTLLALAMLMKTDLPLIMVTNQSGIGRGIIEQAALAQIHEKLDQNLSTVDVFLTGKYYCPHVPEDHCGCRKPKSDLFLQAKKDHDLDLSASYLIGDSLCDVNAAEAIDVYSILVRTGNGIETEAKLNQDGVTVDYIGDSLLDCANHLLALEVSA